MGRRWTAPCLASPLIATMDSCPAGSYGRRCWSESPRSSSRPRPRRSPEAPSKVPGTIPAETRYAGERERLLATCLAEAQGFFAWQQELGEKEGPERPVDENDHFLFPSADAP